MKEETRKKIIAAPSMAKLTPEKLSELLNRLDEYFRRLKIDPCIEIIEFDAIMRTRVIDGNISLIAPDFPYAIIP